MLIGILVGLAAIVVLTVAAIILYAAVNNRMSSKPEKAEVSWSGLVDL